MTTAVAAAACWVDNTKKGDILPPFFAYNVYQKSLCLSKLWGQDFE